MTDKVFVDSNIWLYALTTPRDGEDMSKHDKAIKCLSDLSEQNTIIVSIQVINEFHWNMLRKFKINDNYVADIVKVNIVRSVVIVLVGKQ